MTTKKKGQAGATAPRMLTFDDVTDMLAVAVSTLRDMIARGDFPPPLKIGKRAVRWRAEDVEAWITNR